jgi:hypothetical protein
MRIKTKYIKYLPHLSINIGFPFFTVRTHLLMEAYERCTFDICRLDVLIYKWRFSIDIYYPTDFNN